jgi:hypothetical protein
MEWIFFDDRMPTGSEDVLACDWYPDYAKHNFRMHVCESEAIDQYFCGELTGKKVLSVKHSICPEIGNGLSPYWMQLPNPQSARWIKFDMEKPPKWEKYHEVLLQMKNGDHYTGFIENWDWCPSFNMFKHGDFDDIDYYMELPKPPKFIETPKLSTEEKLIREKKSKEWLKNFIIEEGQTRFRRYNGREMDTKSD